MVTHSIGPLLIFPNHKGFNIKDRMRIVERLKAGVIGATVLVVVNLIFELLSYPTFAAYGFKQLVNAPPIYYFVTNVIISFGTGLAFSLLYIIVRGHIEHTGMNKGIIFGLLAWALSSCAGFAYVIAYTTLPVIYTAMWLIQQLVGFMIYGLTMVSLLEPHAHKWTHPEIDDLLKTATPHKKAGFVVVKHPKADIMKATTAKKKR